MYLIVDLGNTLAKFFLYKNGQCVKEHKVNKENYRDTAESLILSHKVIKGLIYSDVSNQAGDFFENFSNQFSVIAVSSNMQLPFINSYQSPESLGSDRIVLVAAACKSHPNTNVLIIDMGTCITYDFLDANNIYQGGAISPGFEMRYKSLNQFTGNLPLLDADEGQSPSEKILNRQFMPGFILE